MSDDQKVYKTSANQLENWKRYYWRKSPEWRTEQQRKNREARINVYRTVREVLGDECKHCGYKDLRALCIDHISGGGTAERRKRGRISVQREIIRRVRSGDLTVFSEYQLLCANCNMIKAREYEDAFNGLRI